MILCPRALSAFGSAPATSASPPVFANGTTSEATNKIFNFLVSIFYPFIKVKPRGLIQGSHRF